MCLTVSSHLTVAWGIIAACLGLAFRVAVFVMCFHSLLPAPPRKRRNRYSGPPLSLRAQRDQSAGDAQGVLFP